MASEVEDEVLEITFHVVDENGQKCAFLFRDTAKNIGRDRTRMKYLFDQSTNQFPQNRPVIEDLLRQMDEYLALYGY